MTAIVPLDENGFYAKEVFEDIHTNFESWYEIDYPITEKHLFPLINYLMIYHGVYLSTDYACKEYYVCAEQYFDDWNYTYSHPILINAIKGLLCKILLSANSSSSFVGDRESLIVRQKRIIQEAKEFLNEKE